MKRFACFLVALCLLFGFAFAQDGPSVARKFLLALMAGDQNDALYTRLNSGMQQAIPKEQFGQLWQQIRAFGGEFERFDDESTQTVDGYTVCQLHMVMAGTDFLATVTFDSDGLVSGLYFTVAEELAPATFITSALPEGAMETDVVLAEGTEWALPGTLTLPANASAPVPAVVMVHGSGPNDRDETIGKTKLFRDLAHALAEAGFASLRYDKRTFVYPDKLAGSSELEHITIYTETIDDALAAVALLRADERISSIYLLGHSLGAMVAPEIARLSGTALTGMILVSGTPDSLFRIMLYQSMLLTHIDWDVDIDRGQMLEFLQGILDEIGVKEDDMNSLAQHFNLPLAYSSSLPNDMPQAVLDLKLPTLIVNGGADFQVHDTLGMDAWREALGDTDFVTYRHYADLNHVLMRFTGEESLRGTVAEYYFPAVLDAEARRDIIDWLSTTEKEQNGL